MKKCNWCLILKIAGAVLALVGVVCLIVAYWDKISAFFGALGAKCKGKCVCEDSEYDDYADDLMYE